MTYAFDVPSYVQGFRFSDDPAYYDAERKHFRDLAGYDHLGNGMTFDTGTPSFATVGGKRAIHLDNQSRGRFFHANPWQGTMVVAMKPLMTANVLLFPVLFCDEIRSQGPYFMIDRTNAADYDYQYGRDPTRSTTINKTSDAPLIAAFSSDQNTRRFYSQEAGGALNTEAEQTAGLETGNLLAMGIEGQDVGSQKCQFGALDGRYGNTDATEDCYFYELHFFTDNILVDHPTEATAFLNYLAEQYA